MEDQASGKVCLFGAVNAYVRGEPLPTTLAGESDAQDIRDFGHLFRATLARLREADQLPNGVYTNSVVSFNDCPRTTEAHVFFVLDQAEASLISRRALDA